jgi:hypothetical protein
LSARWAVGRSFRPSRSRARRPSPRNASRRSPRSPNWRRMKVSSGSSGSIQSPRGTRTGSGARRDGFGSDAGGPCNAACARRAARRQREKVLPAPGSPRTTRRGEALRASRASSKGSPLAAPPASAGGTSASSASDQAARPVSHLTPRRSSRRDTGIRAWGRTRPRPSKGRRSPGSGV